MDKNLINAVVEEVLKQIQTTSVSRSNGVISKNANNMLLDSFGEEDGISGAKIKNIFSLDESKKLGCGVLELDNTEFDWTLTYDEIMYTISGELQIVINSEVVTVPEGNVVHIPNGSSITFKAPKYAKVLYITYPADWE